MRPRFLPKNTSIVLVDSRAKLPAAAAAIIPAIRPATRVALPFLVAALAVAAVACNDDQALGTGSDMGGDAGGADAKVKAPTPLVDEAGAILADVSADQKLIAWYGGASLLADKEDTGALTVRALPTGTPAKLDDGAFHASFNRGTNLTYATGQTASQDAGDKAIYGALHFWTPSLSLPVKLTTGIALWTATPPDNAFVLFEDAAMASRDTAKGTVSLVRAADCTVSTCTSKALTQGGLVLGMAAAGDGKSAAYGLRVDGALGARNYESHLVDVGTGGDSVVGTVLLPDNLVSKVFGCGADALLAFSPDGTLFATVDGMIGLGGQLPALKVVSTASGATVSWGALPSNNLAIGLTFADNQTLIVKTASLAPFSTNLTDTGLYRITPAGATQLAPAGPTCFSVSHFPVGAERWLFVTTGDPTAPHNLQAYDLMAAAPTPVPVATAAPAFPVLSPDLSQALFSEAYDAAGDTGTATVMTLPGSTLATVAAVVRPGNAAFGGAGEVVYIDVTGALQSWTAGKQLALAHGVYNLRLASAPATAYYTVTVADTVDKPPVPTGIYGTSIP